MIGQHIGNYVVVGEIGRGGMSTVYEATHAVSGQRAAVKVLNLSHSQEPALAARFKNEARAVGMVPHPGLVRIFDQGQLPDGCLYLIMEYLEGETLGHRISRLGRLPVPDAMRLVRQIASAVAAAHDKGVVHRDLKPDNVIIVADPEAAGGERARVLDFGIAKLTLLPIVGVDEQQQALARTHAGMMMGTPAYMSPEQCRGASQVDGQTDVYAVGVMLYQILSGKLPFKADTPMEMIGLHMYVAPHPLSSVAPELPQEVVDLAERMLAKDRDARPSMREVLGLLETMTPAGGVPVVRRDRTSSVELAGATPTHAPQGPARRPVLKLGALGLLFCVGGFGLWTRIRPSGAPVTGGGPVQSDQGRTTGTAGSVDPALSPDAATQEKIAEQPKQPVEPVQPVQIDWSVESTPAGAEVFGPDGERLGTTPLTIKRPPGSGKVRLRLHKPGYKDQRVELDAAHRDRASVRLNQVTNKPAAPPPNNPDKVEVL